MADYPRGVDLSNNNGHVNFDALAASGVQFVICKASEGTYFRDGWFGQYWSECKRLSIARGAYHFARPSESGATAEADYFLDAIRLLYGDLETGDVLALDLEDPYAQGDLSGWCLQWLQRVEQSVGFRPMVYVSPSYTQAHYLARQPSLAQYGLWLASWGVPTPPPAPSPWSLVAIHQIGVGPAGSVPGVAGQCDLDRFNGSSIEQFKLYGKPSDDSVVVPPDPTPEPEPEPPPSNLPIYDAIEPAQAQDQDFDCSQQSASWQLWSYSRTPDDDWMEQSMIANGVMSSALGLLDASGAGLAGWLNDQYGEFGYVSSNDGEVSFDDVATEAATGKHPVQIGGRSWGAGGHWSGCRGYDAATDTLLLANPANGYDTVYQTMTRSQWADRGPWSLVRLTHPAAEADPPPDPPPVNGGENGGIGSGLLAMMAADGTMPAQRSSTWLPLGVTPSDVEQAYGVNGVLYYWLLGPNQGYRQSPS